MGFQSPEFDDEQIERMDAGTRLESVIREWFGDKHPEFEIEEPNCIYQHPILPWTLVNVDGIIIDKENGKGLLECKNVGEYAYSKGDWSPNEVPFYYMCQQQWGLYILGLDWGYFAYLVGGNKFSTQFVKRDDELIADLASAGGSFWNFVETKKEPPQDHLSKTAVTRKFPARESDSVDLGIYLDEVRDLKLAKEALKEAEKDFELKANIVRRIMEHAEIALLNEKKIIT